jgi:tetratricopeptide (TPR) repeat protein
MEKNYYDLLGIDSSAPSNQVRKAYVLKIREFPNETHPEEFQRLTKAYQTLFNEELRAQYDHEIKDDGAYSEMLELAIRTMNKEQYKSALATLENLLKSYPDDINIQQNMAICYMALDRDEEAKGILLSLEVNDPNDEKTLSLLGQVFNKLKLYKMAETRYSKLVKLNPIDKNYLIHLSNTYANLGNYQNALDVIEENLNQGKHTVYDFPLFEQLFFITMIANFPDYHKRVIGRIKNLPTTKEEKRMLLNMLMDLCESLDNDYNGFKELIHLVKDINGNEDVEVNTWLKTAESSIRSDLIYYGDPQPSYQDSTPSSQSYTPTTNNNNNEYQERGSIVFAVILGIIASFILTPIVGIIVGFVWYFNAAALKKILGVLVVVAVIIVIIGIIAISNM